MVEKGDICFGIPLYNILSFYAIDLLNSIVIFYHFSACQRFGCLPYFGKRKQVTNHQISVIDVI